VLLRGLLCAVSRRRLGTVDAELLQAAVADHRKSCERCAALAERIAAVDVALAASVTRRPAPDQLRDRVLDAYHREIAGERGPSPRLPRMVAATGVLAVGALLGAILWSRLDDFGPPPRTVRIELPVGSELAGEPRLSVRRASGVVEELDR